MKNSFNYSTEVRLRKKSHSKSKPVKPLTNINYHSRKHSLNTSASTKMQMNRSYSMLTTNASQLITPSKSKLTISRISYEVSSHKLNEIEIENRSLKHDILVLLSQLKEKETIISSLKSKTSNDVNSYLFSVINERLNESEKTVSVLMEKNYELKKQNEMLLNEIHSMKHSEHIQIYHDTFDELRQCKQYAFSYIVTKSISKKKKMTSMTTPSILSTSLKQYNHIDINGIIASIYKPFSSSHILEYSIDSNTFKLIPFIDYSNFTSSFDITTSKYITINSSLFILNSNILYKYSPLTRTMVKCISLEHKYSEQSILLNVKDNIAIIDNANSVLYNIKTSEIRPLNINKKNKSSLSVYNEEIYLVEIKENEVYIRTMGNQNSSKVNNDKNVKINNDIEHCVSLINKGNMFLFTANKEKSICTINLNEMKIVDGNKNNHSISNHQGLLFESQPIQIDGYYLIFDSKNNVHCINSKDLSHNISFY